MNKDSKSEIPRENEAFLDAFAFTMKANEACGTTYNDDSSKHELVDPRAVSDFYFTRFSLRKIVGTACKIRPIHSSTHL